MKNPYLISNRLYLRPIELADGPILAPWINHPDVRRTLLYHRPLDMISEEEWIRTACKDETHLVFVIVLRETDQPIGSIGLMALDWINRQSCFGLLIGDQSAWGKGYGTEATSLLMRHAFETLNLNRVWLEVYEYNPAARRLYEKVGFQTEGMLRQDRFIEGRYWDTIVMGLLREDWQAAKKKLELG